MLPPLTGHIVHRKEGGYLTYFLFLRMPRCLSSDCMLTFSNSTRLLSDLWFWDADNTRIPFVLSGSKPLWNISVELLLEVLTLI